VRRQTMHQFVQMGLALANPDKPDRSVNSPKFGYVLETAVVKLARLHGTPDWNVALERLRRSLINLRVLHHRERDMAMIPVKMPDGQTRHLTAGGQNTVIRQIIEEFCPRFTPGGEVIYVGDAGGKLSPAELAAFDRLGVRLDPHGKMPDVVVHLSVKNWLVFIEAAASHGPIDNKRKRELQTLMKGSTAGLVYVTAVPDRKALTKYLGEIAWETEVWVANSPTHMIHLNGERFLGPYDS
jgi:hypothetical protein